MSVATNAGSPILPGDLNGDGALTNADIDPFLLALFDPSAYALAYPLLDPDLLGDFNGDNALTNADIDGFIGAIFGVSDSRFNALPGGDPSPPIVPTSPTVVRATPLRNAPDEDDLTLDTLFAEWEEDSSMVM